jgi:hypothetical protein
VTIDVLLDKLEAVRPTGPGRWLARCPAHADTVPSLSIRELDDGRVLVHDFGECTTEAVLAAVGLRFDDLFPERAPFDHCVQRERRPFNALDVLQAVEHEALVVAICASRLGAGHALTPEDRDRVLLAAQRLRAAVETAQGAA